MKHIKKVFMALALGTAILFLSCMLLFYIRGTVPSDATVTEQLSADAMVTEHSTADTLTAGPSTPDTSAAEFSTARPQTTEQTEEADTLEPLPETASSEPILGAPEPEAFQEYDISLMAVGDNLMHMGVVNTGKQEDGSYDYSFLFEGISPFLDNADIKIINQETILGGNERGFSGYPYFNSPTEVGDAIAAAGFNVVLQASNHSADQKLDGLLHCADFWDNHPDVLMTGIHKDEESEPEIPLLTFNDITFAILNYTYGANLEVLPEELEGHLNLLCGYDEGTNRMSFTKLNPQVIEDITKANELADIVIVCPHWGTEYTTKASSYQQTFATQMTEAGADLIIGTHPHVVQPVQWITAENGNQALCYYSLGNYVSTQKDGICMLEGMAWVTFRVTENEVFIQEENTGILPLVCHYTSGPVRIENIYLLEDYTAEQAKQHGIRSYGGVNLTLEDLTAWSVKILGNHILTKQQVLNPQ